MMRKKPLINLEDLTLVIFTLGRKQYVLDLVKFWSKTNVRVLILDGSKSPISRSDIKEFGDSQIKVFHNISIYHRYLIASQEIKTKFAIWHADDDFLIPEVLSEALVTMGVGNDYCLFSTVRGFSAEYLQRAHNVDVWRKNYEILDCLPDKRALTFSQNRANRFFYAIWPSDKFRIALEANARAGLLLDEKKLIFMDIGLELAGALLSKLKIFDRNFLLKRENLVSQPSATDVPMLSEYFSNKTNESDIESWINEFSITLAPHLPYTQFELTKIVKVFFRELVERELKTNRNVFRMIKRHWKKLVPWNWKDSRCLSLKYIYAAGSWIYRRSAKVVRISKPISSESWLTLNLAGEPHSLEEIKKVVLGQGFYSKEIVD